jgi:DNA methylase/ParB-like nuclease family protein
LILEHDLTKVKLSELKFDNTNPNQLTQDQMKALRLSMERFGYLTPIVVDQNNLIADGEHRALIYKEFGIDEIPAYRVTFSDDTERRLLRQTMNKLRGQHDYAMDADEMALIYESDKLPDLSALLATHESTLKELMLRYRPELPVGHEDDEQLDQIIDEQLKRTAPDTKLGDIIQLGRHRLICADCTDKRSIENLLEGQKPNLLLTDPPYGINIVNTDSTTIGGTKPITIGHLRSKAPKAIMIKDSNHKPLPSRPYRQIVGDDEPFDPSHLIGLADHHIIFGANYFSDKLPPSPCWIVWLKKHEDWQQTSFADCELLWSDFDQHARVYRIVWMGIIRQGDHSERVHPTQKPTSLLSVLLKDFSKDGSKVFDPYLGSGSTLIACEQTGRICYGCEIDPHYCDVIIKRWENYTNNKAVKL